MADKYVYSGEWHVCLPDGAALNLNSEEAADYLLGLLERVEGQEARLRKRERKRAAERKRKETDDD